MLGDDSLIVREEVRRQYESGGREGLPSLRRATTADSPVVRGRARTLLLDREKTLAIRRLLRHVTAQKIDLEKALFLLARYHDPRLDPRPWQVRLDALAREVSSRIRGGGSLPCCPLVWTVLMRHHSLLSGSRRIMARSSTSF